MILAKRSSAKCFKHEHKRSVGYTTCKCVRRRDWSYRNLQFFHSKIIPCHLHYTKRQVLMRIVNRKPLPLLQKRVILHLWYKAAHQKYWPQNPVRFFVVRFEGDVLASDPVKTRYKCLWFSEDLLPFHFTDSGTPVLYRKEFQSIALPIR